MTDKRVSQLTAITGDLSNVFIPGIDLTRAAGDNDIKLSVPTLAAALGVATVSRVMNTMVQTSGSAKILLYSTSTGRDLFLSSLQMKMATIAGGIYNYRIYAGDPDAGGNLFYDYFASTGLTVSNPEFYHAGASFIPAALGASTVYLVLINTGGSPMLANVQALIEEISGHAAILPGYVYPEPYGGQLYSDVYVSPDAPNADDHWTEPRFALMALADGGTMHVAAGRYYLPFGVASVEDTTAVTYSPSNDDGATFNELLNMTPPANSQNIFGWNSTYGLARFTSINIVGPGNPLNADASQRAIFDGRGGYGDQPTHPYRLARGKGFIYIRVPGTISGIQFYHCGGDDHVGDGESAIYPESFPAPRSTLTVTRCAFDNCEHGLFVPYPILPWTGDPGHAQTGENINLLLDHCDFGYEVPNGGSDGLSHDLYVNCYSVLIQHCNFYGANGNSIKGRTPRLTIDNVFARGMAGRAIDYPDGGNLTITNSRLGKKDNPGVTTINLIGYANEDGNNVPLGFNTFTATNTVIEIFKWDSIIWIGGGVTAVFDPTSKIEWYALPGQNAPILVLFTRDNSTSDLSIISGLDLTIPAVADMATALPAPPPPASQT